MAPETPPGVSGPLPRVAVSIVSHGHGGMVQTLVQRLLDCPSVSQIIVTRNIPENSCFKERERIEVLENRKPLGFGANHNQAFKSCRQPFFCILNPDIEISEDPFPALLATLQRHRLALVAPRIMTPGGDTEDSFRYFPSAASLVAKALYHQEGRFRYDPAAMTVFPDWVAGMFMLMPDREFSAIGGFDESYFLYYEDVDLCARLRLAGKGIGVDLTVSATHRARRSSRRDLGHMRMHIASMVRYLWRYRGVAIHAPNGDKS